MTSAQANTPAHQVRFGSIKAVIWRNATNLGDVYSVRIVRLYKTDGRWVESPNYNRDDLLVVAKVADAAHTWIHAQAASGAHQGSNEEAS